MLARTKRHRKIDYGTREAILAFKHHVDTATQAAAPDYFDAHALVLPYNTRARKLKINLHMTRHKARIDSEKHGEEEGNSEDAKRCRSILHNEREARNYAS